MIIFCGDEKCNQELRNLNETITSFERSCGREYLLLLVPANSDEEVHMTLSGKPGDYHMSPEEMLKAWMIRRSV